MLSHLLTIGKRLSLSSYQYVVWQDGIKRSNKCDHKSTTNSRKLGQIGSFDSFFVFFLFCCALSFASSSDCNIVNSKVSVQYQVYAIART